MTQRLYNFRLRIPPDQSRHHAELPFLHEGLLDWRRATALRQARLERTVKTKQSGNRRRPMMDRRIAALRAMYLFIRQFVAVEGRAPSTCEIARWLGKGDVTPYLCDLARLGFIEITPRQKCGIRVRPIQPD